ncbi:aldehyde dehydrogenase family protein, partial [Klebsiella pneumoniae]|uniref:aldehyde dehydrogenase family protein n=1 Tax=Klebsiella pneumoniae TaxID=573 RepID=UPI0018A6D9F9
MMNLSATHAVSVNPTTGEVVSSLPWASEREVDAAIALAAAGYRQWRQTPLADRADALRRLGACPVYTSDPAEHRPWFVA